MDGYIILMLIIGVVFLAAAVLPGFIAGRPVTLPILFVGSGLLMPLVWSDMPAMDPLEHGSVTERLAELGVIVSLMTVGLQLDRPLGWRRWRPTWGLLAVGMPLSIAAVAAGGYWLLGLSAGAALLLGAVLAPTDPVVASDVQVGPPQTGDEHNARFALTSEAGLNDGLAFPFVNLAILVAASGWTAAGLAEWAAVDVAWKILAGLVVGVVVGRLTGVIVFRWCGAEPVTNGFIALALTLVAYAVTIAIDAYGFIAVFVAGLAFRRYRHDHDGHRSIQDFNEQIERMLMAFILVLFGASVSQGLLRELTWTGVLLAAALILVIRPAAGLLSLLGAEMGRRDRAVTAVYGIRGIGTIYYLAHGLNKSSIGDEQARLLWSVAGLVLLASIVLHGSTASLAIRRSGPDPSAEDGEESG